MDQLVRQASNSAKCKMGRPAVSEKEIDVIVRAAVYLTGREPYNSHGNHGKRAFSSETMWIEAKRLIGSKKSSAALASSFRRWMKKDEEKGTGLLEEALRRAQSEEGYFADLVEREKKLLAQRLAESNTTDAQVKAPAQHRQQEQLATSSNAAKASKSNERERKGHLGNANPRAESTLSPFLRKMEGEGSSPVAHVQNNVYTPTNNTYIINQIQPSIYLHVHYHQH